MKKIKWLLPFFLVFLVTGCYNYRELNQLALTSAIGIDKVEEGYQVTVQVLNTQKQGSDSNSSGDQPKFVIYQTKAETIQKALREVILESPRRLYVNHIDMLLISEEVAKDGIQEILDFFARNTEFRKQFLVVISQEKKTEDILEVLTPLEVLNAKNIKDSILADTKYFGMSMNVTYEELLNTYLNQRTDIVLPSVKIIGKGKKGDKQENIKSSIPDTSVELAPLAVFQEDKLLGYLNIEQSRSLNYVRGNIQNSILTYKCGENQLFSTEVISSKIKTKVDSKTPKIMISVTGSGNIKEINCDVDLTKSKTITQLQQTINQKMEQDILKDINEIIDTYHTDVFGFEELLYKNSPKQYQKLKKKYGEKLLEEIEVEVKVQIKLLTKGNIIRVIER